MNNINDKSINKCTSCQLCSAVCPTDAIKIILDEDGFYSPLINDNKCISCGICKKYCYKYDNNIKMTSDTESIKVYASQTKDKELLLASSSGGVATHIMKECLRQGYKIIGVKYDTDLDIAIDCIAGNEEEIQTFKGSKYMQSYTEKAFKELLKDKTEQKYAIFGTPCQIYAFSRYIKQSKNEDRFLLVDIFCHGCPSMHLWTRYLQSVKENLNVTKFDKIEFRSKIHGWHEFSHYFIKGDINYRSKKVNDPFFTFFFDNSVLCESCYNCKTRSTLEYTDIRLGDFWGNEYALNREGVSAVAVVSEKGRDIFDKIKNKFIIKEHTLDEVNKSQSYGKEYHYNEKLRRRSLELLKTNNDMGSIVKEYKRYYTLKKRIKSNVKRATYILPTSIRYRIKRSVYRMSGK